MEYLMTYGWAILAVMVVGLILWQLGIFNLDPESASASGFIVLKPMLASCQMRNGVRNGFNGFVCTLANNVGTPIRVTGLDYKVDGAACQYQEVVVITPSGERTIGSSGGTLTSSDGVFDIPYDTPFQVVVTSAPAGTGPCAHVEQQSYEVTITIDYEAHIGGIPTTKSDYGKVVISGAP